jgi:hypothetical protein
MTVLVRYLEAVMWKKPGGQLWLDPHSDLPFHKNGNQTIQYHGGINMRKAYPNEIFHAVNSAYDYNRKKNRDAASSATYTSDNRVQKTRVRRINSPSDFAKAQHDINRINANRAFEDNKDKRRFHDLLNRAISQANAGEANILKSNSGALANFAAECRRRIAVKKSNFEEGYAKDTATLKRGGGSTADIRRGRQEELFRTVRESDRLRNQAGRVLSLNDEEWSFIETKARTKGWDYSTVPENRSF